MRVGILYTRIRAEEKLLLEAARSRGVSMGKIEDRGPYDLGERQLWYDAVLNRSLSYTTGLYTSAILEAQGTRVVNSYDTGRICGDKLLTNLALERQGIETPRTLVAFNEESALGAIESLGYPVVLKPVIGSWGRLLAKINDREAAEAILEHKGTLGSYMHSAYYIQQYIDKPGRDIRAFVMGDEVICAVYRQSSHWITNTARGGTTSNCPVDDELRDICLGAADAVGSGILAIDLMENSHYVVHEVNHTMEFRNSIEPTGVDIPNRILDYVLEETRR